MKLLKSYKRFEILMFCLYFEICYNISDIKKIIDIQNIKISNYHLINISFVFMTFGIQIQHPVYNNFMKILI